MDTELCDTTSYLSRPVYCFFLHGTTLEDQGNPDMINLINIKKIRIQIPFLLLTIPHIKYLLTWFHPATQRALWCVPLLMADHSTFGKRTGSVGAARQRVKAVGRGDRSHRGGEFPSHTFSERHPSQLQCFQMSSSHTTTTYTKHIEQLARELTLHAHV